jgi:hypothetical protein
MVLFPLPGIFAGVVGALRSRFTGFTLEVVACSAYGGMTSFSDVTTILAGMADVLQNFSFTLRHAHYTTFFRVRPFQMREYEKKFP